MRLLLISLFLVVLFFIAYFSVEFGALYLERKRAANKEEDPALSSAGGEGAFRDIYFFLWAAIFWSGLCFLLPLALSFRSELQKVAQGESVLQLFIKVSIIPLLLLFLIFYGRRRSYLRWIKELNWPKQ